MAYWNCNTYNVLYHLKENLNSNSLAYKIVSGSCHDTVAGFVSHCHCYSELLLPVTPERKQHNANSNYCRHDVTWRGIDRLYTNSWFEICESAYCTYLLNETFNSLIANFMAVRENGSRGVRWELDLKTWPDHSSIHWAVL